MNAKALALSALVLSLLAYVAGTTGKDHLRSQLRAAQNERALSDSLKVVWQDEAGTISERLAVVQDSERDLRTIVQERVPNMARRIDELEGTESALIEARAIIDSLKVTNLEAVIDTVIITEEGSQRELTYRHSQPGVSVEVIVRGIMDTISTPTADIVAAVEPIDITIGIFELPTGEVGVDVVTPPWVKLGKLITNVTLPEPTWWEKHDFKIGVGIGALVVLLIGR